MRLLLEDELESVFGGQDTAIVATTLATNYVNASSAAVADVPYTSGPAFGTASTYESGGQIRVCYASYYKALPNVPNFSAIKCVADHVDYPGETLDTSYSEVEVNAYQYVGSGPTATALQNMAVTNSSTPPSGFTNDLYGLTSSTSTYKQTAVSAGAFAPYDGTYTYTDPVTQAQNQTVSGPFTAEEQTIIVYGHEAAHQRGLGNTAANELLANGYGIYALNQYRANKAAIDAACGAIQ